MHATIPPGSIRRVISTPLTAFRPERLLVSPQSFPLPLLRRVWTWPLVKGGNALLRVQRGLAKLLRVDLYAARERREYVSAEYAREHVDEVSWDEADEEAWDVEDEAVLADAFEAILLGRPFVTVPIPLSRRARALDRLGRSVKWLRECGLRWQCVQLSTLIVHNIIISDRPQFAKGAPLPADMLAAPVMGGFVNMPSSGAGHAIEVHVENRNRRECRLVMSFVGTST